MITRTLTRRLERLEAYLAPPSDEPAMIIRMTCVGQEGRIIEVWETTLPTVGASRGHRDERFRVGSESDQHWADPFFWPNSTAVGSVRPLMKIHLIDFQLLSFGVPSASAAMAKGR
jgi:hypothetical protein